MVKRKNKFLYILGAILIALCAVITPFMFNDNKTDVYARGLSGNIYYTDYFNDSWSCSFSDSGGYTNFVEWDAYEWGIFGGVYSVPFDYGDVAFKTQTRLNFSSSNNNYIGLDLVFADNAIPQISHDLGYNSIDNTINYSFGSGVRLTNLGTNTAYFSSMSLNSEYFSVSNGSDYCHFIPTNYLSLSGNSNSSYPYVTFLTYNTGNSTASFNYNNLVGVSYGNNVAVTTAVNSLSSKYQFIDGVQQTYNSNTITNILSSTTCVDYFTSDGCHLVLFHSIAFADNNVASLYLSSYSPFLGIPITYYFADGSTAYATGYSDGYTAGDSDGYTRGYNAGYSAGETAGYDDGYSAGYSAGVTAGETTGYQNGYSAGETAGYQSGYADGVDTAQDTAYQSGYNAGQSAGYTSGYNMGYSAGYYDGENAGLTASGNGPVNPNDTGYLTFAQQTIIPYSTTFSYGANDYQNAVPDFSSISTYSPVSFSLFSSSEKYMQVDYTSYFGFGTSVVGNGFNPVYYTSSNGSVHNLVPYTIRFNSSNNISVIDSFDYLNQLSLGGYSFNGYYISVPDTLHDFDGILSSNNALDDVYNLDSFVAIPFHVHYENGPVVDGVNNLFNSNFSYYYVDAVDNNNYLASYFFGSSTSYKILTYHFVCFNGSSMSVTFYVNTASAYNSQPIYLNRNLSKNADYEYGYNDGEYAGYSSGYSDGNTAGYSRGYIEGKNFGYNSGVSDANEYTFFGLITAVIDAPIQALFGTYNEELHMREGGLLNFEILGVNLSAFFYGLISICLVIVIIKFIKGGK